MRSCRDLPACGMYRLLFLQQYYTVSRAVLEAATQLVDCLKIQLLQVIGRQQADLLLSG